MGSWTCSICDVEERWPTKQQALNHIEDHHIDILLRSVLERSSKEPTEELDFDPHEPVVRSEPVEDA